jgi:beta-galactosidase
MEQAHMHVVRVGEFAWSTMEPSEGHFDFTWLDHAIALAAKHHIATVLGTPTAAPPAWLTTKYPETLRMDSNGRRDEHGNRQQFSFTDPLYRRFAARIALEMAKRYGHNPNVLGWQIDNELARDSNDPTARASFHAWLAKKYGTIDALNKSWATAYWSQTYDNFDEIPVKSSGENPALLLDYKRWVTDVWISYCNNQIAAIRPNAMPSQFITTNTMHWNEGFDHYKLHTVLDLAAWDDYFPDGHLDPVLNAALHDLVRGYKQQNFWVMETQPAFVNWGAVNAALPRGVTREMAWQAIGHGADAVLYWQWRAAPNGQEEYHGTLVGANGKPTPVYAEIQQFGSELDRVNGALRNTHVVANVAVLQDYDSHWAIDFQRHTNKFDYDQQIEDLYKALAPHGDAGTSSIDMVQPMADLARYKIVFAPSLNVLPEATAQHLIAYVRGGGHLVLTERSGMKREDNGLQPEGQPGSLSDALGAHVEQFYALDKPVPVSGAAGSGTATIWAEQITPTAPDTRVLLTYGASNGWLDGKAAAVTRLFGKGSITYLGATLDPELLRSFVEPMLTAAGVHPLVAGLPDGVELMQRVGADGKRVWIVLNHDAIAEHVDLHTPGTNLLATPGSASSSTFDLPPHGVAIFQPARAE